ncbi:chromosome replication/partitioning protein [Borreliella garinii]|uniref:chromosome replication/partitioning protein n=1 Tax=Borreliella garinii TaxID=29519 RepID=UPI00018ACEC1|nr:chromosome replication/partitioning protein [Borreliella garinii]ACL35124.1 putative plasmid partition protein [Borreliella garinii Far04]WNZ68193.1 chromosome replication/partitioning protein [Borreliella garinii]WNZ69193.1 chromosome replication/partitioning protein [Borreliella garinii]WNZ70193.1 chromosome replication/partitioning protein [Borreliella garinii]
MDIKINKRNLYESVREEEQALIHYNKLKEKLNINFQKEIYCKLEAMKVLKEIKDKEYYKLDNYFTFDDFAKDYRLARTQTYKYLKIATAIEEGIIEEKYVVKNGINETICLLKTKESPSLRKSNQNPIKPLRFQLKKEESYYFYKKNAKLTSFLLEKIFFEEKDFLLKIIEEFETLRNKRK